MAASARCLERLLMRHILIGRNERTMPLCPPHARFALYRLLNLKRERRRSDKRTVRGITIVHSSISQPLRVVGRAKDVTSPGRESRGKGAQVTAGRRRLCAATGPLNSVSARTR
ncbi:unnamed protein product, partial [Iphiclides podalirius]